MARTNSTLVKAVFRSSALASDYDGTTDLAPFIRTATLLVDRVASCATRRNWPMTTDELQHLESLVAAWSYCCGPDTPYQQRSTDKASGSFQGQTGMRLESNYYGQQALLLDTSGCLETFDKRKVASAFWAGKLPNERIPIDQRS